MRVKNCKQLAVLFLIMMIMIPYTCFSGQMYSKTKDQTRHYSRLVYPEKDGRMEYAKDESGNTVPDFSYAGYCGGGVRLPNVPVKAVVKPGGGNDAGRIQEAIDRVSALTPDKNGFRGAVLIKRGLYELDKPVRITAGGVVLRGEGQDENGTVLFAKGLFKEKSYTDLTNTNLVEFTGASGAEEIQGNAVKILDAYMPVGGRSFRLRSVTGLKTGDTIIVRRFGNR
ncbi:MAG: hypothetical protein WCU00_14325, partial [Candidatus Latescibacterota bacterium]